jgi:hypothetical protein
VNKTIIIKLVFLVLFIPVLFGCEGPESVAVEDPTHREDFGEIDISKDPVQTPYTAKDAIIIEKGDIKLSMKPLAKYEASAIVARKRFYSGGWQGKVAPVDLVLVWGRLAEPDYDKYMTYTQRDRWYYFEYKAGSPFNASYVYANSSNNHIVPANENIYKAIRSIKKKEKAVFEGYLVSLNGSYEGQKVWWNTSLSRNDSGDGSCEIFYVERIRVENKVYE